jgi:acetyl-CoA carboxylase biotin carboxyl carrier protein
MKRRNGKGEAADPADYSRHQSRRGASDDCTAGGSDPHPDDSSGTAAHSNGLEIISSPIVGTFYRSPAPDAHPFVLEGAQIKSGDTLCIIEAMKVMNKLEAEFNMEIVSILVPNSEMVEHGTPLFEVKRV